MPTRGTTRSTTYFDRANKWVILNSILTVQHPYFVCVCQLTNKRAHCAPDNDCMERGCPHRLTRLKACFCQSPTLHGPHNYAPPSLPSERQSSRLKCLLDYRRCFTTIDCPVNNSAVSSEICSANQKPNVRLACPKSNTKKRPIHTSFPPAICNLDQQRKTDIEIFYSYCNIHKISPHAHENLKISPCDCHRRNVNCN